MKSQFINGLAGELHNLLVKKHNILNKPMDQIICTVTNVEAEINVSLKVLAVNSQPQGDSWAAV